MKKLIRLLIITILFIPCVVNAAQCDPSKVYIDSISVEDATKNLMVLDEPTIENKKVNLVLSMSQKDDEILYKLVIKNDSNEDYEINKNSINLNSDYINYSLESNNNNIVKANSSKTVYLRVKYTKEVDKSKFVDNVYQDNITMRVNLRTEDTPANPKTGLPYMIIISLILIVCGVSLIIYKKKKLSTLMILVGILLLPIGVNALCSSEIEIDSTVYIRSEEEGNLVVYQSCLGKHEIPFAFMKGMTIDQYLHSFYVISLDSEDRRSLNTLLTGAGYTKYYVEDEFYNCMDSINYPNKNNYQNAEEYNQAYQAAINQEDACYTNYGRKIELDEPLISKSEGALVVRNEDVLMCKYAIIAEGGELQPTV